MALGATLALAAGCATGPDDELAPPTPPTTTSTPAPTAAPVVLPVGHGPVGPSEAVWAQGSILHVGRRSVDLSPAAADAFVVVPGGVFLLRASELWFTDLTRLRGTGLTSVTGLGSNLAGTRLRVEQRAGGHRQVLGFDTATGHEVPASEVSVAPPAERLRRAGLEVALGPGGRPLVTDTRRQRRVVLSGAVPTRFELGGWAGPWRFYGVSRPRVGPAAVVGCDVRSGRCARWGAVAPGDPVVFGTGV